MSAHACKFQSFIQLCKLSCDEIFDFFCRIRCGKSLVLMGLDPSSVGSENCWTFNSEVQE
jgi:hypothetical protein